MKTFMNPNRFEAFSDGVFAIAMTLIVIEIKVPNLSQATASTAIDTLNLYRTAYSDEFEACGFPKLHPSYIVLGSRFLAPGKYQDRWFEISDSNEFAGGLSLQSTGCKWRFS
jgi:Endosomal/lysosomal potassium channel TMEM175